MKVFNRIVHFVMVLLLFLSCCTSVHAYQFNGWVLDNPSNVKVDISSTISAYRDMIIVCYETWETYCPEIGVTSSSTNYNVNFYCELDTYIEAYAVTYHHSDNSHSICIYADFLELNTTRKKETIVHKFGHALGLAHCETTKNTVSVMRETGFNDKAYPLSDDIAGIAKLY